MWVVLLITILYMIGGQFCGKYWRRFVIPPVSIAFKIVKNKDRKNKWQYFWLALNAVVLCLGYGEGAWLRKMVKGSDIACRILYGLLLAIPFCILGNYVSLAWLPMAFSIRAGSVGSFMIFGKKFDILIEDIVRGLTIGGCVLMVS